MKRWNAILLVLSAILVGPVANVFCLLVFGVNEQRWKERAGCAETAGSSDVR